MTPSQDWFAYMRVSGDAQRDKQTIETQRREIERTGLVPSDHIFADDGVSGMIKFGERPGSTALWAAMNNRAKSGGTPRLLVNYLDRLGRDGRDTVNVGVDILEAGWTLRTIFEGDFENTPEGRLKVLLYSGIAESGRFRIIKGTGDGLRAKAERGGYVGGFIALGYVREGVGRDAHLVVDVRILAGCHLSAPDVVRQVFQMAAEGKSCQKIADWLTAVGVPTSKQNRAGIWRPNGVRVIIRNPIYKGVLQWGRHRVLKDKVGKKVLKANPPDKVVTATVSAIVSEELWERANNALHQNQLLAMAHSKTDYLLSGRIVCALCGCKYAGRGTHYACIGRHCAKRIWGNTRPPCEARPIRREDIDGAIWHHIAVFFNRPGAVINELEQQIALGAAAGQTIVNDIGVLGARRERLDNAEAVALRQLTRGMISEGQYDTEIASIRREEAAIDEQLVALRKQAEDRDANARALGEARSLLETLRSKVEGPLPFERQRRIVDALVENITVETIAGDRPKITVGYRFQSHFERNFSRRRGEEKGFNGSTYAPA
jgi:site-specific DNA recombinase